MFKQIIYVTNDYLTNTNININNLEIFILNYAYIIDNNSIKSNDEIYEFDYLIFDEMNLIENLNIKHEHKRALVNYYLQTNFDNIFAVGNANNSNREKSEELETITDYLING